MTHLYGLLAFLFFSSQSNPPPQPVLGLLLILSVVGALVDHRYKKAGGKPSSTRDRTLFLLALLLVAGFFILMAFLPIGDDLHDPFRLERIEGQVAVPLAVWLFFAWELGRWRMRRKYPLSANESQTSEKPTQGGVR
jgi:hypothetical protein